MKIERINIQSCCGAMGLVFKTDQPILKSHIVELKKLGFVDSPHFTQAGLLYVDNSDFTITGPIGSNKLTVKCKHKECTEKLNNLEVLFQQMG